MNLQYPRRIDVNDNKVSTQPNRLQRHSKREPRTDTLGRGSTRYRPDYDPYNHFLVPGYPRVHTLVGGILSGYPGYMPEYNQNNQFWYPGYMPEYDQNNQV